jgi:acyl-CoA synthetase (AMP-forming)/AMP-acid ligase II
MTTATRRSDAAYRMAPRIPWSTVPELLAYRARRTPDATALVASSRCEREVALSWHDLNNSANRIGNVLVGLGVEPGTRVGQFLSGRSGAEEHGIYHGVHAAGCVNVPLNTRYTVSELEKVLEVAQCGLVFVEANGAETIEGLRDAFGFRVVSVDGSRDDDLAGLVAHASDRPPSLSVGPDDECDWVFTSGTTATPKAAAFTQRACVATGIGVAKTWELVPDDVYQSSSPFFTSTGIHTSLLGALAAGATYYLEPSPSPREWANRVAAHRSTEAFVNTAVLKLVLDQGGVPEDTTLRRIVYGGQALPTDDHVRLYEEFTLRRGVELLHLTGSTEGGPTGVYCPPRLLAANPGSIGDRGFAPWTAHDVVRDDGSSAEEGEIGELWYAAPSIMSRYVGQPEATAETIRDGGIMTGDLVELRENGFIWFVDRKKDIIRRGGLNIASAEIEAVLQTHAAVAEAAVVPVPHDVYGEEVRAVVVTRADADVTADAIKAYCAERLADYKVPVVVDFIDALPRNAMGKVVKPALRGESYGVATPNEEA